MATQSVSVIVSSRNAAATIAQQLDSVYAQLRVGDEMIVVDDASTDNTPKVVGAWKSRHCDHPVTLLRAPVRGGPNASRNAGVYWGTNDLLVFADGDDVVCPGWLEALRQSWSPGAICTGNYRLAADGGLLEPQPWFTVPTALGGAMAIGRTTLETLGGFDESILRGGSEVEFVVRAQLSGLARVAYVAGAEVSHQVPTSTLGTWARTIQRSRGHAYLAIKHGHHPQLAPHRADSPLHHLWGFMRSAVRAVIPRRAIAREQYLLSALQSLSMAVWLTYLRIFPVDERLAHGQPTALPMSIAPHLGQIPGPGTAQGVVPGVLQGVLPGAGKASQPLTS